MYNIINFVISFGALQGLIIGVLLFMKALRLKQNFFYLALVLLGFSGILGRAVIIGVFENESWFFINLNFILLVSPAFYFLAKQSSVTNKSPLRLNFKHFLPFAIVNIIYILFYFLLNDSGSYKTYLLKLIQINDGISILYFSIYLFFTYKIIRDNKVAYGKTLFTLLNQLAFIFFGFLLVWFVYVLLEWFYFYYSMELVYYYPMLLLLAVMLYYLSLQVVFNKQFLFDIKEITSRKTVVLEEIDSKKLLDELALFMKDEKPFLEADISLITLAESLQVNPKSLSFVINEHLNMNFNQYINDWRIEEVKMRLDNKAYDHFKMLSIAFDCGFNSKSTFNLAFKKATGLSPSEYRRHME